MPRTPTAPQRRLRCRRLGERRVRRRLHSASDIRQLRSFRNHARLIFTYSLHARITCVGHVQLTPAPRARGRWRGGRGRGSAAASLSVGAAGLLPSLGRVQMSSQRLPGRALYAVHVRVRFQIIRNARTENVGESQSCMVSKVRMTWKQALRAAGWQGFRKKAQADAHRNVIADRECLSAPHTVARRWPYGLFPDNP